MANSIGILHKLSFANLIIVNNAPHYMAYLDVFRVFNLHIVLCFLPNFFLSTEIDLNFFAITQVWVTKTSNFVTFVIISRYYVNQFDAFSRHSRRAFES